jgi:hypothetical protein
MTPESWFVGGIVSVDPLVTYTSHQPGTPLGIARVYPDLFQKRKALHLLSFTYSAEAFSPDDFGRDIAAFEARLVDNRFVALTK